METKKKLLGEERRLRYYKFLNQVTNPLQVVTFLNKRMLAAR